MTRNEVPADQPYLGLLADVSFRPVFIMGDHRSGSTLLYILLNQLGCFNVVQAYHIIKRDEILANHLHQRESQVRQQISSYLRQSGMTNRFLDQVEASADLPEEYGFVLGQGFRPRLDDGNLPRFIEFCRKVQFTSGSDWPLLLKNPWDIMNFAYVISAFPEARFIFLHRHPVHRINSQIKAARALYQTKSPYHALLDRGYDRLWKRPLRLRFIQFLFSSSFDLGFKIAMRHVVRASSYFLEQVTRLSEEVYCSLKFEDLCQDAKSTLKQVMAFLELGGASLETNNTFDVNRFVNHQPSRLLDEVVKHRPRIIQQLRPYLTYCNYPAGELQ